jgi:hypothetical protein
MSSPGQQGGEQGGGQGQQGGAGSGTQSNPNQVTTTSSGQQATSTIDSPFTPTSTSSSSSGNHEGAIIGGVVGGIAGLLIISLIGVWLLNKRKQRRNGANARKTRPVTYTGLNSVFRGVPFNRRSSSQIPHNSLLPQAQSAHGITASLSGPNLRGGQGSPALRDRGNEMDNLPPSYVESQLSVSMASLDLLNTTQRTNSDIMVSPLSSRALGDAPTISPQTTGATYISLQRLWGPSEAPVISPQTTGATVMVRQPAGSDDAHMISPQTTSSTVPVLLTQHTRDTMGFPIDERLDEIRLQTASPAPIISPVPRHPLVHQDSLERVVRQGLMPSESPIPSVTDSSRLRVLSQEMPRESPVLGGMNPVRMMPQVATSNGMGRNDTQRTVSSVSSMGVDVISDRELERLGVGSKARYHRPGDSTRN